MPNNELKPNNVHGGKPTSPNSPRSYPPIEQCIKWLDEGINQNQLDKDKIYNHYNPEPRPEPPPGSLD